MTDKCTLHCLSEQVVSPAMTYGIVIKMMCYVPFKPIGLGEHPHYNLHRSMIYTELKTCRSEEAGHMCTVRHIDMYYCTIIHGAWYDNY